MIINDIPPPPHVLLLHLLINFIRARICTLEYRPQRQQRANNKRPSSPHSRCPFTFSLCSPHPPPPPLCPSKSIVDDHTQFQQQPLKQQQRTAKQQFLTILNDSISWGSTENRHFTRNTDSPRLGHFLRRIIGLFHKISRFRNANFFRTTAFKLFSFYF